MKKFFILSILLSATFTFAQIFVSPKSKDLNDFYKGGNKQLMKDVQDNFGAFISDYIINGKFVLSFDLDKDGTIINPKVQPEQVDKNFTYDFIRTFKRVKNNFKTDSPKKSLAILVDFRIPERISGGGQSQFTHEPASR
ncbi:hypothetical protein [Halpernia sp. GG3]